MSGLIGQLHKATQNSTGTICWLWQ